MNDAAEFDLDQVRRLREQIRRGEVMAIHGMDQLDAFCCADHNLGEIAEKILVHGAEAVRTAIGAEMFSTYVLIMAEVTLCRRVALMVARANDGLDELERNES